MKNMVQGERSSPAQIQSPDGRARRDLVPSIFESLRSLWASAARCFSPGGDGHGASRGRLWLSALPALLRALGLSKPESSELWLPRCFPFDFSPSLHILSSGVGRC